MGNYDDIIHLPHYEPKYHPRMPMWSRAAQFAPFAALTGYDAAIQESVRMTDEWSELSESAIQELNTTMALLASRLSERPSVTINYFLPDARKAGGAYHTITGRLRLIDDVGRFIVLADGTRIPLDAIRNISAK